MTTDKNRSFELYKHAVPWADLPALDETWFPEALAKSRAGDQDSTRDICGRCLHIPLAEEKYPQHVDFDPLELVQEGNDALVQALREFTGSSADEFSRFTESCVRHRIELILDHPAWYRELWRRQDREFALQNPHMVRKIRNLLLREPVDWTLEDDKTEST